MLPGFEEYAPAPADAAWFASSESSDWWTPRHILDAVVTTFGEIDLDPCSNLPPYNVPAKVHYTIEDDGLRQTWLGRAYINPPYGEALPHWINKLRFELAAGNVTEAITLTAAKTETRWFQTLWQAEALCFVRGRLRFAGPAAGSGAATFPSVLAYFGPNSQAFATAFAGIGQIVYPGAAA